MIAPAEVAKGGVRFFDDQDDIATPSELVREIETFLTERDEPVSGTKESAT